MPLAIFDASSRPCAVGMGESVVTADLGVKLICLGLGSCVAICAYAPRQRVGGMVHVVLPEARSAIAEVNLARYANTAVPLLIDQFRQLGVPPRDLRLVLCGGAAIFPPLSNSMDIGKRNVAAIRTEISRAGLSAVRQVVGGNESRTITLAVNSGQVLIRTVQTSDTLVAELGNDTF